MGMLIIDQKKIIYRGNGCTTGITSKSINTDIKKFYTMDNHMGLFKPFQSFDMHHHFHI